MKLYNNWKEGVHLNYKKLIQSRSARIKIQKILSFVPDNIMVCMQYKIKTGRKLDLKKPERYTEKLQWYKLFYRNPLMQKCVDKFDVRDYVVSRGLSYILNKCYGVFDAPDQINWSSLPNSFVLKDTLGSGGNSVILVSNKDVSDKEAIMQIMNQWVKESTTGKHPGREWVYEKRSHRILIEKMLLVPETNDLPDYKFFCFNGKVHYFYVRYGYTSSHAEGKMSFFDRQGKYLPNVGMDYCDIAPAEPCLGNYIAEMITCAEKLAEGFPHVRVDFYYADGKVIFGEMTFFNASGYMNFSPDEFDFTMGDCFELPHT